MLSRVNRVPAATGGPLSSPVSKAIAKITVRCPHCHAEQQEPALVKSTFCRRCSEYFAITPSSIADAPPEKPEANMIKASAVGSWARAKASADKPAPPPAPVPAAPKAEAPAGVLGRFEGLFANKPKTRVVRCFECSAEHEISSTAHSSTCKACGAYIDLQDYKVTGSFSRNIKTLGTVYLSSKGDLSSSKIVCSQATIHGKMRGNLVCPGRVTIKVQGKLFGSVEAGELVVEKGSDVAFTRPIQVTTAEIHGRMSGLIMANGHVTIYKSGLLDGAVSATGFSVEKGGCFQGELTISPRQKPAAEGGESSEKAAPAKAVAASSGPGLLAGSEQAPAMG